MIRILASTELQTGCSVNGGTMIKSKGSTKTWQDCLSPRSGRTRVQRLRRITLVDGTSTAKVRRWSSFEVRFSSIWGTERLSIENESVISFAIASKEVTVEQFQRFLKENPRYPGQEQFSF